MDAGFIGRMMGLGIDANIQKFLENKRILNDESFALMAADEKEVRSEILPFIRAGGYRLEEMEEQVAIKKLWMSCRRAMAPSFNQPSGSAPVMVTDELPSETNIDLKAHWKAVHGYILPDTWLLSAKLQMTLWKGVHATTPSVEVVLIERLRLLCQSARDSGTLINASTMTASRVEVDQIHGPLEVYSRSRAWFMTMAYASIRKPAWFDLQTAVFASEKIFDLVQRTSGGRFPPLGFLIEAWANTVNHFAEQVRVTGKPLSELVVNTGTWEHKWTWTATQAVNGGGAVDLPRHLANDVADAATQARHAQSMMDRQANARRHIAEGNAHATGGYAGGKGGGGKGKNAKGKDNFKGKQDDRRERDTDRRPDRRGENFRERSRERRGNGRR